MQKRPICIPLARLGRWLSRDRLNRWLERGRQLTGRNLLPCPPLVLSHAGDRPDRAPDAWPDHGGDASLAFGGGLNERLRASSV